MDTKHTAGPWAIGLETTDLQAQVIAADGGHICYVENDPVEANARLIAAAPELLEALQRLLHNAEVLHSYVPDSASPLVSVHYASARMQAEMAIARAEGR